MHATRSFSLDLATSILHIISRWNQSTCLCLFCKYTWTTGIYKLSAESFSSSISSLLNLTSITVVAIHKSGRQIPVRSDLPISLHCLLSKCLELIRGNLCLYLAGFELLNLVRYRFVKGRSLLKSAELLWWITCEDRRRGSGEALGLDFSKALMRSTIDC